MSAGETTLDVIYAVRRLTDPRLAGRHKSVLFALASFRERDGTIAPSNSQIVDATCESRATVFRALAELEAWGLVKRTHRGRHASAAFELLLPIEGSQRETSHADTSQRETTPSHPETREVSPCDPLRIFSEDPSEALSRASRTRLRSVPTKSEPAPRPGLAAVPLAALDEALPQPLRAAAEAVIAPAGVTVDVDLEWAKYVADRATRVRAVSGSDWRGWVLKAIGFAKQARVRESDRRSAGAARAASGSLRATPGQRTGIHPNAAGPEW